MDEKTYNGIHSSLQTSGNSNSVWHNGKDDNIVSISSDFGDYSMECHMPIQDHRNGGELACSPNHSKPHIFGLKKEGYEIFLRGNRSETDERIDIRNEQTSSNDKSENDANIVFECSNHEKIKELQSSLEKLFRDCTLVCSTWTKKTTETLCHLVLPNDEPKNKEDSSSVCSVSDGAEFDKSSCINSPILVEILRKSDSCRVATSLCLDLQTEDPEENTKIELQYYIMNIKQFDGHALWSLGDYFDIMSKEESEKNYDNRTAWDVLKDRTV
ncbi:29891_t:CDS:2, partial [Gigaspora margarita]